MVTSGAARRSGFAPRTGLESATSADLDPALALYHLSAPDAGPPRTRGFGPSARGIPSGVLLFCRYKSN